jgi:hypothetical protein
MAMSLKAMIWAKNALEFLFITGLIDCATTVVISWISILKSALSEEVED